MSWSTTECKDMTFETYMEKQRISLNSFVDYYAGKFEEAMENGKKDFTFQVYSHRPLEFPEELLLHELRQLFPQYDVRMTIVSYDPGECELHVDSYTVRISGNKLEN